MGGPVVAQIGAPADDVNVIGICIQLAGVTCSACKYVFAHSVMQKCKKDLGTFAFLFWIDVLILFILVPWAVINGELIAIVSDPETPMEWFNLLFTAVLGGIRFFSQLLVLRVSTATTLSCANLAFQAINIYLSLALLGGHLHLLQDQQGARERRRLRKEERGLQEHVRQDAVLQGLARGINSP